MAISLKLLKRKNKEGLFITFEGIEGAGKSTHIRLLAEYLKKRRFNVIVSKEPGGTQIGEQIRKILLDPKNKMLTGKTELFLLLANRAQHITEKILPHLKKGFIVISDRYIDSSVAYQGGGRKIDPEIIKELNRFATEDIKPDITFILDVDVKKGIKSARAKKSFKSGDRIERENIRFHKRVQKEYYKLAKEEPERIVLIKLKKNIDETQNIIRKIVVEKIKEKGFKI